jgi:hypothetical protein
MLRVAMAIDMAAGWQWHLISSAGERKENEDIKTEEGKA